MVLETGIKHDQGMMKRHHTLLVFRLIKRYGSLSRAKLTKLTQMSATSVGRIVKELIKEEFIIEVGESKGSVGRRAIMLEVNPNGGLFFGVNIEKNTIDVGVVDLNGSVQCVKAKKLVNDSEPMKQLNDIIELIEELKGEYHHLAERIVGCGISVPGIVDFRSGKVLRVPQLRWNNVNVKEYLESKLGIKVFIDNQVKAILISESMYGSAVGVESAACIYVGSGLGAAFMENSELIRGVNNMAGEIGHTIISPNGMLCDCGRVGCLQTYICSSSLEKESGRTIDEIFNASYKNEKWAVQLIEQATEYLAMTISNVVCTYNPEVIILAGTMVQEFPDWAKEVEERVDKFLWDNVIESVDIQFHSNKTASILGASCIVLKEFLESPF